MLAFLNIEYNFELLAHRVIAYILTLDDHYFNW